MSQLDKHYTFFASQKLFAAPRINVSNDGSFNPTRPLAEDKGKTLLLLNWISFCLVSEATEQSIAAALAKNPSDSLDIVLATNVPITPIQQEYTDSFLAAINGLMHDPHSTEHGERVLLALIARYAWKRVHRKASLVIHCGNPFSKSKETTTEIITRLVSLNPAGKDLLTAFNEIISLTPSLLSDDPKERLETLVSLMDLSATVISSPLSLVLGAGVEKDNTSEGLIVVCSMGCTLESTDIRVSPGKGRIFSTLHHSCVFLWDHASGGKDCSSTMSGEARSKGIKS